MTFLFSKKEKEMIVSFGKPSRELVSNKLELSLLMAEKFLTNIPDQDQSKYREV
jgi:hypothetical protein